MVKPGIGGMSSSKKAAKKAKGGSGTLCAYGIRISLNQSINTKHNIIARLSDSNYEFFGIRLVANILIECIIESQRLALSSLSN